HNVEAHTYLGVMADQSGDLAEAERQFAAAARAAPQLASARNNYGASLLRLGRTTEAQAQFEASLKLDRDQPSALVNLAQIRFAAGTPEDLRAARDLFARADALAPDYEIARALVVTSLRLGDREGAARHYLAYATRLEQANEASAAPARAELAAALLAARLFAEASKEASAALAADPANVSASVTLARAYLQQRDIKAAGRVLETAVARGVEAAPVYATLADVYAAGGYYENAIPAMRRALALAPADETYHFRYGLLLTDSHAPAAAIIRLQESLKQFPQSASLWLALGIAQLVNGQNNEAEASFKRSLALDPKSTPALAYLGTTYAERGEYARAIELYERTIAADDRLAVPYYLAADVQLKLPDVDFARAEKYLARAIELDPSLASARLALAKLYVRGERWPEAAAQLERAVQLAPDLAEAHYQLSRVYVRLKRTPDAQKELAAFKQLSDTEKEQRTTGRRDLVRRLADVRF
ncbi:MAG TPA: tetratricopeptide repeat protein, partial [Pyrinomonadaceae bacterium]